jgi:DDE superfamily endonuclease
MSAHTSHLLQPLDISCFPPLKRLYGQEVQELVRQEIHHIDKDDFLTIYSTVRQQVFTEQNIKSGF